MRLEKVDGIETCEYSFMGESMPEPNLRVVKDSIVFAVHIVDRIGRNHERRVGDERLFLSRPATIRGAVLSQGFQSWDTGNAVTSSPVASPRVLH